MKSKYGLIARLVWDGDVKVKPPEEMGQPRADQLLITTGEVLSELAGRVCYDSLGRGRSSQDFHKHILEVGHLSVYEHFQITVRYSGSYDPRIFWNRPGIWVESDGDAVRLTYNPRVVLDWHKFENGAVGEHAMGNLYSYHLEKACPYIVLPKARDADKLAFIESFLSVVPPRNDHEKWISLFMAGSRGYSHEQVRHGNFSAISQRSTRYVSEDESPWVDHPLVQDFLASDDVLPWDADGRIRGALTQTLIDTKAMARRTYSHVVEQLEKWLINRGVDKLSARKQARGAARGYLGNALYTEMIFSASVAQWKHMLRMRASDGADGEIRAVYVEALGELKASRYGSSFDAFSLVPAQDGIGMCAVERYER